MKDGSPSIQPKYLGTDNSRCSNDENKDNNVDLEHVFSRDEVEVIDRNWSRGTNLARKPANFIGTPPFQERTMIIEDL